MADIEMVGGQQKMGRMGVSPQQQPGGSTEIDMVGGAGVNASWAPASPVQKSGSDSGIDMVGGAGVKIGKNPVTPYDSKTP
jgi:hypothetical protein